MFSHGLVEETHALLAAGHGPALRALRPVGYDAAIAHLEGRLDREGAELRTNQRTAQLAKRQRTWFRHQARSLHLDAERARLGDLVSATLESLAREGLWAAGSGF